MLPPRLLVEEREERGARRDKRCNDAPVKLVRKVSAAAAAATRRRSSRRCWGFCDGSSRLRIALLWFGKIELCVIDENEASFFKLKQVYINDERYYSKGIFLEYLSTKNTNFPDQRLFVLP